MMSKYSQGANFEREVAGRLERVGMFVTRAAGSGTADRAQADVVAIDEDRIVIAECKNHGGDWEGGEVEWDQDQIDAIRDKIGMGPDPLGDKRAVHCIVAIKSQRGGPAQYCVASGGKAVTGEDTAPLYELINDIEGDEE